MISVTDLEQVAKDRLEDSLTLAIYGRYDGSVYLCGYALEIALKVRICKLHGRSDFPENTDEFKTYNLKVWQTHAFEKLLELSGLRYAIKTDPKYSAKYSFISSSWEVDYRYKKLSANDIKAYDMIEANEILLGSYYEHLHSKNADIGEKNFYRKRKFCIFRIDRIGK